MRYGYARVSTKGQLDGNSIEEQTKMIKDVNSDAEMTVESYSGAKERPLFNQYHILSVRWKLPQRARVFMPMTKAVRWQKPMESSQRKWQRLAKRQETKIELTAYDDLFKTNQSREEANLSKIKDIPISQMTSFKTTHSRF